MTVAGAPPQPVEVGFDRRFVTVVAASLAYFVGLGILAPVLPQFIEDELDGGGVAVGIAVGAFAVTAALLRPWVGRIGDRRGRRVLLVVGGCLVFGLATLGYGLAEGLAVLVLFRLVAGVGEAATFIGAATLAQDLAPPARRGQAASLFSISVYGGLSFGPLIGDWVYRHHGAGWSWVAAATASFVGAGIGMLAPDIRPAPDAVPAAPAAGIRKWLHPAGLGPGVVLALGAAGYAGFASFVPLYVDDIDVESAGPVFFTYGAVVLSIRILWSRLPDILGPRRGPRLALLFQASGLALMWLLASPAGLYGSTVIYAIGVSLLYPALFPAVVDAAPASERSSAIATFTLFFDLSQGLGAPLLGVLVSLTGADRSAFLGAAVPVGRRPRLPPAAAHRGDGPAGRRALPARGAAAHERRGTGAAGVARLPGRVRLRPLPRRLHLHAVAHRPGRRRAAGARAHRDGARGLLHARRGAHRHRRRPLRPEAIDPDRHRARSACSFVLDAVPELWVVVVAQVLDRGGLDLHVRRRRGLAHRRGGGGGGPAAVRQGGAGRAVGLGRGDDLSAPGSATSSAVAPARRRRHRATSRLALWLAVNMHESERQPAEDGCRRWRRSGRPGRRCGPGRRWACCCW